VQGERVNVKRRRQSGARRSAGAVGIRRPTHSCLPPEALVELALFESSGMVLPLELVDCRRVIDAVCSAHNEGATEHRTPFRSSLTVADLEVLTNERVLERIVEHLTTHALQGHTSVRIAGVRRSSNGRESVEICVSDRGPGLPVDACAAAHFLATPFAGPTSVRLRVCRRLAKLIHGRITQRVDCEQGRTFTLTLKVLSKSGKRGRPIKPS
jgi:C4-dicarboxylate-specific signal transduction histidine kinase